jgi:hypothetical protein
MRDVCGVRFSVVLAAITTLLGPISILADGKRPRPRLRFPTAHVRYVVERAIDGAKQRLTRPECQHVFTDFQDRNGNSLLSNLIATGKSPGDYLDQMWFVDATDAQQCQRGDMVLAYTSPGNRVVYVCGSRFIRPEQGHAELVIIHELLHSLGLGENPPTSAQITTQVMRRCNR